MIISNGNYKVLEKCILMLDDKRNDLYILFDKKTGFSEYEWLLSIPNFSVIKILPEHIINWGILKLKTLWY